MDIELELHLSSAKFKCQVQESSASANVGNWILIDMKKYDFEEGRIWRLRNDSETFG